MPIILQVYHANPFSHHDLVKVVRKYELSASQVSVYPPPPQTLFNACFVAAATGR